MAVESWSWCDNDYNGLLARLDSRWCWLRWVVVPRGLKYANEQKHSTDKHRLCLAKVEDTSTVKQVTGTSASTAYTATCTTDHPALYIFVTTKRRKRCHLRPSSPLSDSPCQDQSPARRLQGRYVCSSRTTCDRRPLYRWDRGQPPLDRLQPQVASLSLAWRIEPKDHMCQGPPLLKFLQLQRVLLHCSRTVFAFQVQGSYL